MEEPYLIAEVSQLDRPTEQGMYNHDFLLIIWESKLLDWNSMIKWEQNEILIRFNFSYSRFAIQVESTDL